MKTPVKIAIALVLVAVIAALAYFLRPRGVSGEEVLVLCGGSMREVLEDIVERYAEVSDTPVQTTYGGSGELCAQIQQTGKGDLYLCHDPFMPWAAEQGLIDEWDTMAQLDVLIVVPKGNPRDIRGIEDLAKEGLRVGVGSKTHSTSGVITEHLLRRLPNEDAIRKNIRLETKGHQQRCTDVTMGTLDAAVVWNAVAHQFREKLDVVPISKERIDVITSATYEQSDLRNVKVTIGIISHSSDKDAARDFYRFMTEECRGLFAQHGFTPVEE